MNAVKKVAFASAVSAAALSNIAVAEGKSFVDSIKEGKATLDFRYRFEDVSQDGTNDAQANTLRTRLNFQTGAYQGFSGFIEFDQVSELLEVDYNDGTGNGFVSATIADPEGTDLNQSYIQYMNGANTFKYGRQRIILDNQRYVGGVGWRQNEQTFDAFSFKNTSVKNLSIFYAYVTNVNTIFGTDIDAEDHLLNASYKFNDAATLTGYAYLLDVTDVDNAEDDTLGLRFSGASSGFNYSAEYARQSARKAGQAEDYSASYTALVGGYTFGKVNLGLGYEILGADGTLGEFETKYGTKHAFQGWADKFLNTPNGGMEDFYLSVGAPLGPVSASLAYHMYSANDSDAANGADDLGSELDLVLSGKAGPVGLMLKYADYSADDFASDTQKLWLMASLTF